MPSTDLFMIVVGVGFFALMWAYVAFCNRA